MKSFSTYHPIVLFIYYLLVIFMTMFFMHPNIILLSLLGSLLFYLMLTNFNLFLKDIGFYSVLFILIVLTNPLFVHKGETILFFLNDNPVTLEAILYGMAIASMLVAIMFWSKAYSELMTTDKFLYLFGRLLPKLALLLSMAFRFIPLFKAQIKKVHTAQKTLGLYTSNSITDRVLSGVRVFNSILTWTLENAVHQADAMKARGYGLPGRTNFSIFKIERRDLSTLLLFVIIVILVIFSYLNGSFDYYYYPTTLPIVWSIKTTLSFISIFILTIFPFIIEVKENLQWKLLEQKILDSPIQNKINQY